jgi:hypothetical protein
MSQENVSAAVAIVPPRMIVSNVMSASFLARQASRFSRSRSGAAMRHAAARSFDYR